MNTRNLCQRVMRLAPIALIAGLTCAASAQVALAPVVTKSFNPTSIPIGGTSTMTVTLTNPNTFALNNVLAKDTMPAGIDFQGYLAATTCDTSNYLSIPRLLNVGQTTLNAGASCSVVVTVMGTLLGPITNTTDAPTATQAATGIPASATLTMTAAPPAITKAFNPANIAMSATSVITFTITNTNPTPMNNVSFNDPFPAGVIVNQAPNVTNTCGGTVTAVSNGPGVSLGNGSIAANSSCTITVTVQGTTPGVKVNLTTSVSGTVGGNVLFGPAATATLNVDPSQVSFLIRYASNLSFGESVVNFTNTGASSTAGLPTGTQNGEICANVYAYSPDEQLVSCCSCNVTPNALNSLSVKADLGTNTLTPIIPSALVIKVIATAGGAACTASSAATANTAVLQPGLEAWGTTIHALPVTAGTPATTYGVTETAFAKAAISQAELDRMSGLCAFIRANGSGYGICKSCKVGGLGASVK